MPKTIEYVCSKCLLNGSTYRTWGQFKYKIDDTFFEIHRELGICNDCNLITPVEILPFDIDLRNSDLKNKTEDIEKKLKAFKDRKSPSRCLKCGGHNFDILPPVKYDPDRARSRTPIRTSLYHKNCGGRIYANPYTPHFFMGNNLPKRIFTIEGIEIT